MRERGKGGCMRMASSTTGPFQKKHPLIAGRPQPTLQISPTQTSRGGGLPGRGKGEKTRQTPIFSQADRGWMLKALQRVNQRQEGEKNWFQPQSLVLSMTK